MYKLLHFISVFVFIMNYSIPFAFLQKAFALSGLIGFRILPSLIHVPTLTPSKTSKISWILSNVAPELNKIGISGPTFFLTILQSSTLSSTLCPPTNIPSANAF